MTRIKKSLAIAAIAAAAAVAVAAPATAQGRPADSGGNVIAGDNHRPVAPSDSHTPLTSLPSLTAGDSHTP
ncbi:hypothetical protein [Streptomyces sp. NPDC048650]|uniref:hypothetical protein n=1 Tax=unclassified Streptomyces TaxID=2593676 RepID=UPI00371F5231